MELADDAPWRSAVRRARQECNEEALQRLAQEVEVERQPARSLIALARALPVPDRLALLHRARDQHQDDFWLNMELALACFAVKPRRTEDVLRFATVAVALRDNPPCQLTLGMVFTDLGRFEDAETAYRQALALQPDYQGAYYNLANMYGKQGRYVDAETVLQEGIRRCPKDAELYSALGHTLRKLGYTTESEAAYRQALHLKPNHAFAQEQMILLCLDQNRWQEGLTYAQRATQHHPMQYWSWMYLGKVLSRLERWPEALSALQKAQELKPDNVQTRQLYERARSKAALSPESKPVRSWLGWGWFPGKTTNSP